jgi:hypothetical protein
MDRNGERGKSEGVCAGNPIVDMIRAYMPRPTSRVHEFARIGATARIKELQAEIASIRRDFPALGASGGESTMVSPPRKPGRPAANLAAKGPSPRRRRRKMSAEARKKISEAQKKRWAAQKAKK